MTITKEKFIVDRNGKPVQVVLDISEYEQILEELEELDCIRIYDEAKKRNEKPIPFKQAIKEIESKKK
jgi:PHD/YefM family antitoxin component YafN of YafNO toxin-antitoxin module